MSIITPRRPFRSFPSVWRRRRRTTLRSCSALVVTVTLGCAPGGADPQDEPGDRGRGGGGAIPGPGNATSSSSGGAEGPVVADAEFLGAKVPGARTDVLELTFSGPLRNVSTDDFFTNRTHALVKTLKMTGPVPSDEDVVERANGDGSYTYVLQLSDHVVPGETPELVYFRERSDVTDLEGTPIPTIPAAPVDVSEVDAYHGEKTLVRIAHDAAWSDVVAAMDDDTIVAIERGFSADDVKPIEIEEHGLTLTAYGAGTDPKITWRGNKFFSVRVSANHLTLVGLHLVSDGMNGIGFDEYSSYGAIIDCTFDRLDTNDNAQAAINFYFPRDKPDNNPRVEGPKALFNAVLGHNGGIEFSMSRAGRYRWKERYVEDLNGDGYRQPAMIIGNYIKLRNHGSDKGDAIAVSRADHNWAEVSYNLVEGWVDDGFDAFQGLRVIVEYNTWDQQNTTVQKGGNAIKSGGFGRDDEDGEGVYSTGYSGDIIIRYNVVKNTGTEGGRNPYGINTNGGGGARGRTNEALGVTYGKTLIYGNFIYNTLNNALQMYKADGRDFEVYNNLFISSGGGMGVRFTTSVHVQDLVFRNNIVSSAFASDGIPGHHNLWLTEFADDSTYELGPTDLQASLEDIFDGESELFAASVRPDSPTRDAGDLSGIDYPRDGRGTPVGQHVDIGPVEATGFASP